VPSDAFEAATEAYIVDFNNSRKDKTAVLSGATGMEKAAAFS
jgi:hypothetical protein